ncbi:hypothetical protein B0T21DRAFT_346019 [Apiosordaria backusii]|uniref:Uncharacterized protein n=1 Tax=Apiosordaria backusii TaxID=314023 RepID=A0AA40K1F8_9PEZI|nr:hypothetical protein B0T21DRAFT_346019 [Apiosordaria backusii]
MELFRAIRDEYCKALDGSTSTLCHPGTEWSSGRQIGGFDDILFFLMNSVASESWFCRQENFDRLVLISVIRDHTGISPACLRSGHHIPEQTWAVSGFWTGSGPGSPHDPELLARWVLLWPACNVPVWCGPADPLAGPALSGRGVPGSLGQGASHRSGPLRVRVQRTNQKLVRLGPIVDSRIRDMTSTIGHCTSSTDVRARERTELLVEKETRNTRTLTLLLSVKDRRRCDPFRSIRLQRAMHLDVGCD